MFREGGGVFVVVTVGVWLKLYYILLYFILFYFIFFFFKQKTAYEMCGRDWSSDVCSSDLSPPDNLRD